MIGLTAPVAGAVAQTVTTATPQTAAVPASPVAGDAERFQSAMTGGGPGHGVPGSGPAEAASSGPGGVQAQGAPGMDGVAGPTPVPPAPAASGPSTPGDAILRGLQRMNGGFHASLDNVGNALSNVQPGQAMNSADLMRAQLALTQVTMQQDLMSKVVGKVTSNLDTFLKNG